MQSVVLSKLDPKHLDELSSAHDEPDWLKKYREEAFSVYSQLPHETSPLYTKYSDANKMDTEQVSFSIYSDDSMPDKVKSRLEELGKDAITVVQIGTNIKQINIPAELRSKGLEIHPIYDALKTNSELVKRVLESDDPKKDKYTALNNAFFNSGFLVYIPRGMVLEEPIHVISSLAGDGSSTISRNIVVAEQSSSAYVVQELYSSDHGSNKQQAYLELMDIVAKENSDLKLISLQALGKNGVSFSTRTNRVEQDGRLSAYLGLFGGFLSRYKIDHHLVGDGASVNDYEVVFGDNNQSFDITANPHHEHPNTSARVLEKSILKDTAKSLFKGIIRIEEDAKHSDSYLAGHSILLNKGAKSDSIPGLEIFTNDVKATHSASVSQIDEEQLFYLASRCIPKEEAKKIIVEGFVEPLTRNMSVQIRAWIAYLIDCKWSGKDLTIKSDEELKKYIEVEEVRYREKDLLETHYKYR